MNRADRLRVSLFVSLGLLPLACGGTVTSSSDRAGSGGGGDVSTGGSGVTPGTGGGIVAGGTFGKGGTLNFAGAPGRMLPRCTAPQLDMMTGLVRCAEGYVHRPFAVACGELLGSSGVGAAPNMEGEGGAPAAPRAAEQTVDCSVDADCASFQFGYCQGDYEGSAGAVGYCASGCSTDQECGKGSICVCGDAESPTGGSCRRSDCATDADCGNGYRCASFNVGCGATPGFACQKPADACAGDHDCDVGVCGWDGVRSCDDSVCGRPFLVEAVARVAPVILRNDWVNDDAIGPRVDHLTMAERRALADHWTRMGQMEHASIAAFARFSLQLLALGAPPELVDSCTQALADETAHAKLCFRLASAYAGRRIGPGPLDVSGSLDVTSLADVVDLVIAEGCFGETSAALEALEAEENAVDPVVCAAYAQIARDEQRHAELAFRFLRWALARDSRLVGARIDASLRAHAGQSQPLREIVIPCLKALRATALAA